MWLSETDGQSRGGYWYLSHLTRLDNSPSGSRVISHIFKIVEQAGTIAAGRRGKSTVQNACAKVFPGPPDKSSVTLSSDQGNPSFKTWHSKSAGDTVAADAITATHYAYSDHR